MSTTLSQYLTVANNLSQWQSYTAKTPAVQTATQYFEQNIGSVTSAQQLVNNPRLFDYAMTAFGLGSMTYAKGMMQQVLEQGVTSSKALANTLDNSNIFAFAKAFNFAENGTSTTSSASLVSQVVNKYVENSLETNEGQQDPGVQLALYFQQHAPSITSVYSILADKNLLSVVQTALGISPLTSEEPVDTQAQMLQSALASEGFGSSTNNTSTNSNDLNFSNSQKLNSFIEQFAAQYDASNNTPGSTSASSQSSTLTVASLFQTSASGSNGFIDINPTTLLSADNANLGTL